MAVKEGTYAAVYRLHPRGGTLHPMSFRLAIRPHHRLYGWIAGLIAVAVLLAGAGLWLANLGGAESPVPVTTTRYAPVWPTLPPPPPPAVPAIR
jgi:hypothetical protein